MRSVAVIGGGISGIVAALELCKAGVEVVLYEKNELFASDGTTTGDVRFDIEHSCMVFNPGPSMMKFFESVDIDLQEKEMSFSLSLDEGKGYEWGTRNGLTSLFAQKTNALNPYFLRIIQEINKFKDETLRYLQDLEGNNIAETLNNFVKRRGYSDLFQQAYLLPLCTSIWACSSATVLTSFSAYSVLAFLHNHQLLEPFGPSHLFIVKCSGQNIVVKLRKLLESRGCQIRSGCEVRCVTTSDDGRVVVALGDSSMKTYDGCVMAINAQDALRLLGKEATYDETRILGAFQYFSGDVFIHRDTSFMPHKAAAWSAWNFHGTSNKEMCLTFWLDVLQDSNDKESPYLVTLNPSHTPKHTLHKWKTSFRLPTVAAGRGSLELDLIQGKRGIWFCGPNQEYDFDEDKVKTGLVTAKSALGKSCVLMRCSRNMIYSQTEKWARVLVIKFLKNYVNSGCLILYEEGGKTFSFQGTNKKCMLRTSLIIHSPRFYWKVATQADLGLADAYIHGDFSFLDENEGLVTLLMICIANRDSQASQSKLSGWWTPYLYTAVLSSANFYFKHVMRQNSVTQARRNISRHYDLSNEMFSLFLDETMTYSSAIFKFDGEDLKVAQLRKIFLLIEKAKIENQHEVLEIGCGWGSFAIEVVKKTGCKYTGITLSKEQLKYAEAKVKECGLQDNISFLLSDYRQLPKTSKYDRIISCEMIEHVGDKYYEEFFGCCDSLLAEDGLLVIQFQSVPDSEYDMFRKSANFATEYIFPGGCLPSLNRLTSAMAVSSKLCVENLENIGSHYFPTLRFWRKNFLENQSKIRELGFDEKFIRTWEYYFDFFAAGQKSLALETYQIVFSRPGNIITFNDPYEGFPSAYQKNNPL